jgi:hypothetical protein
MGTKAYVSELPKCDLCGIDGLKIEAKYDCNIPGMGWANLCEDHFRVSGVTLGTGKGQELIVGEKPRNNPLVAMLAEELGEGYEEMELQMEDYGFFDEVE